VTWDAEERLDGLIENMPVRLQAAVDTGGGVTTSQVK
jgi:hypothetical protein